MKHWYLCLIVAFVVVACGPAATPEPTATPPAPTPTPIPLDSIDLDPIILQDGDLPSDFEGQQIKGTPPNQLRSVPLAVQVASDLMPKFCNE